MARSGKKRRRVASPPPSFVSETPAQSQEDPIQRRPLRQTDNNSDNDQQTSNIESTTPRGTQKEPAKQLSDELKLAGDICQGFMEGLGVYVGESQVIDWLIAGETFIPHSDRFKFREVEILSVSEIRPPSLQLRVDGGK
ncbi:hypothetical protein H4Q26_002022 [Puccinia striiformis f. sp. tritici PST-130]|nr:hypothetical protein H4Q26_002022 [Puccinia striiformis f. sp. tritici PST-130]